MKSGQLQRPLSVTSQFAFCGLPLRLDSYRGCAFQCTYCFARQRGGNVPAPIILPANPGTLERIFARVERRGGDDRTLLGQFLRQRVPIHFGGMSDPFQPAERRHGVTRAMLQTLAVRHYPTVISTKGLLVTNHAFVTLLKQLRNVVVQFSLTSTNDRIASIFEPLSPRASELLAAMRLLADEGIRVTCRWQPFVFGIVEPPAEFIPRIAQAGAAHVGLEHLKLPVEEGHPMWQGLSTEVRRRLTVSYERLGARRDGREFVLPSERKLRTILEARQAAEQHGITFGAADNDLQYMSHTECCCSGVDQFPGFEGWYKHQIACAIRRCVNQPITYASIAEEWLPKGSIDRFLNSRSRLSSRKGVVGTVRDHIRNRWNDPNATGSPASFFGVGATEEFSGGYRVYRWTHEHGEPRMPTVEDQRSHATG